MVNKLFWLGEFFIFSSVIWLFISKEIYELGFLQWIPFLASLFFGLYLATKSKKKRGDKNEGKRT